MKKLLLFFCIIFTCISCDIAYDGETRIVVEGQLIDKNSNPVSDKKINIIVSADGAASDLISYMKTDANGKFSLVFPSPKLDDNSFIISINESEKNELQYKQIWALKKNFNNYKLDLNQIILYPEADITQLQLILNKTAGNKQLTDVKIEGLQPNYRVDLNPDLDNFHEIPTFFNILKNQNVTLTYTVIDYSEPGKAITTKHNEKIAINTEKVVYTINY